MLTRPLEEKPYLYKNLDEQIPSTFQIPKIWLEIGLVVALLLVALGLRLLGLNRTSIWIDESTDFYIAYLTPFAQTLFFHQPWNVHPPLFYPVLHLWTKFTGTDEFWLRLFSVLMALGTLVLSYFMARRWLNQPIALITLALLSVSSFHIYWSQSIRPYAWFTLLVTISMAVVFFVVEKPEQNWRWVLYGLSASTLIYAHYLAFHIILSQAVFLAIVLSQNVISWRTVRPGKKQAIFLIAALGKNWFNLVRLGLTLALVVISFLPYLGNFLEQARLGPASYESKGLGDFTEILIALSSWFIPKQYVFLVGTICLPPFVFGLFQLWQKRRTLAIWLFCWCVLPPITAWISSLIRPSFGVRFFIFCLPAFLIIIAAGIWYLSNKRRIIAYMLLGMMVGLNLVSYINYTNNYQTQDWRGLVRYVVSHRQPGDVVFLANFLGYNRPAFDYYYVYDMNKPGNMERRSLPLEFTKEQVQELFKTGNRFWVVAAWDDASWLDTVWPYIQNDFKRVYNYKWVSTEQGGTLLELLERK